MVLAGGLGVRMGADRPKQLLDLHGRTILERSLHAFTSHPLVDDVVLVVPAAWREAMVADGVETAGSGSVRVVVGGAERRDSTRAGVEAVVAAGGAADDRVLVHDAARPLVSGRIIGDVVTALEDHDVVALLLSTPDTIVRVDPETGLPGEPLPRAELRRHQTPQGFRLGTLEQAHRRAADRPELVVTDDCTLAMHVLEDVRVGVVEGESRNLKITDADDLVVARALLEGSEG